MIIRLLLHLHRVSVASEAETSISRIIAEDADGDSLIIVFRVLMHHPLVLILRLNYL